MHSDFWGYGMISNNGTELTDMEIKIVDPFVLFPKFKYLIYLSKLSCMNLVELFEIGKISNINAIYIYTE